MLRDQIAHIAELARLAPEPDTLERFGQQCLNILGYIEVLNEVDTEHVEPLYSPVERTDAVRADVAAEIDQRADMLANAPDTDGAFFIVPRIV